MNSQHYFKKLEKFAVCAFQAEKGCIEVELKSESCGIYHYVFYGSAKIGRPFQSEYNIVKKGDFFNMKDYLYQPRIYEALEDVYVWGFNTFPNQNWDARLLTDEILTVEGNNILICLDGKPIVNDKSLWELYHRNRNLYLNFYSDAVWAQLGLYFEKFKHYTP